MDHRFLIGRPNLGDQSNDGRNRAREKKPPSPNATRKKKQTKKQTKKGLEKSKTFDFFSFFFFVLKHFSFQEEDVKETAADELLHFFLQFCLQKNVVASGRNSDSSYEVSEFRCS